MKIINKIKRAIDKVLNEPKNAYHILFWCTLFFLIVIIPWIVNDLMVDSSVETADRLYKSDWLGFWGGYLGSAFGVIASLFAFLFTYIQNENQHKQTRDEMHGQNRLQVLPLLSIDLDSVALGSHQHILATRSYFFGMGDAIGVSTIEGLYFSSHPEEGGDNYFVTIKNIGLGPACNCKIIYASKYESVYDMAANESHSYFFLLPMLYSTEDDARISFQFSDALGNTYSQGFTRLRTGAETIMQTDTFPTLMDKEAD